MGEDASDQLVEMMNSSEENLRKSTTEAAVSGSRGYMAKTIGDSESRIRGEIAAQGNEFRETLSATGSELRGETTSLGATLRPQ